MSGNCGEKCFRKNGSNMVPNSATAHDIANHGMTLSPLKCGLWLLTRASVAIPLQASP
jgi:hypothetical protein